jgi:hypothetical protein
VTPRTLRAASDGLGRLRLAYERLLRRPSASKLNACERAHEEAVALLLEPEVAHLLDGLIRDRVEAGNTAPDAAPEIASDVNKELRSLEFGLGLGLGYSEARLKRLEQDARQGLAQARTGRVLLPAITDTEAIADLLQQLLDFVRAEIERTKKLTWREKRKSRSRLRRLADRYMYGASVIVVDGGFDGVFSYSLVLGMGAVALTA